MTARLVHGDTFTALTVTDPAGASLNVERTDDGRLSAWIAPPGGNDGPSVVIDEADAIGLAAYLTGGTVGSHGTPAHVHSCGELGRVRGMLTANAFSHQKTYTAYANENARLRERLAYLAGEAVDEAEKWAALRPAEAGKALEALIDAVRRTAGVGADDGEQAGAVSQ